MRDDIRNKLLEWKRTKSITLAYKICEELAKEVGEAYYNVISDIIMWGRDKGLYDPKAQLNKVMEEVGEIAHEITRNNYDINKPEQPDELLDAIGDTFVTIIILCDILNINPLAAMEVAYDAIKDRKGKTVDGTFVKEE